MNQSGFSIILLLLCILIWWEGPFKNKEQNIWKCLTVFTGPIWGIMNQVHDLEEGKCFCPHKHAASTVPQSLPIMYVDMSTLDFPYSKQLKYSNPATLYAAKRPARMHKVQ
jgi:hypothetical protein